MIPIFDSVKGAGALLGLADTVATPTASYSLRNLSISYFGQPVVRVRRESDDVEQDFTASQITDGTLGSFCTGTNGFVHTWYDQSGNGYNAVQVTDTDQPKIWDSVTGLVTENGRPAISFNGVDEYFSVPDSKAAFKFLHDGTTATTFTTVRIGDGSAVNDVLYVIYGTTATSAGVGAALYYDDRTSVPRSDALFAAIFGGVSGSPNCLSGVDDIFLPNTQSLVYGLFDADNATASERFSGAVNGDADSGNNTYTNAPSTANATNDLQIGRYLTGAGFSGFYLLGNMQELIFYDTDQSANRTAIEDNINNYYDIY